MNWCTFRCPVIGIIFQFITFNEIGVYYIYLLKLWQKVRYLTHGYLFRISSKFHAEIWLIPSFVGIL